MDTALLDLLRRCGALPTEIVEDLDRLDRLPDARLSTIHSQVLDAFDERRAIPETDRGDDWFGTLDVLSRAGQATRVELEGRPSVEERLAAIDARVDGTDDDDSDEPVSDDADADETADEPEPVPVSASARRTSPGDVGRRRPARTRPRAAERSGGSFVTPVGAVPIGDLRAVAERVIDARQDARPGSGRTRVARLAAQVAPGHELGEDAFENTRLVEAATRDSLTASGGFCAPTDVSYDLDQIADAARPVRDSLPAFQATRGGVRFAAPPGLIDVGTDGSADAAITVHDNDADVAGDDKGVQTVACESFSEVLTQAIVRRLRFGNFSARSWPEQVQSWLELVIAAHARTAETELLDAIVAGSTHATTTQQLGTARELVRVVAQAAAGYRSRNRMADDAALRLLVPAWTVAAMTSDLAQSQPGTPEAVRQTREEIVRTLTNLGVNATFYVDSPTGLGQVFGAQADDAALNPFPNTIHAFLFHEGAWVFLDGGTLDLGIVRDSVLNTTNDFENFAESFEGAAHVGHESLWLEAPHCVNGESQIAVDASTCVGS